MSSMNDDSNMVTIMETLGINFKPAENSIKSFEHRIASLNKQLFDLKANAIAGVRDINQAFSSQVGNLGGNKAILDQYGQPLTIQSEAAKFKTSINDMANQIRPTNNVLREHAVTVQDVAKQYNILGNEFQRRAGWFLTGSLFYGTLSGAREAVQTISEVEMGITEIARVMEDSTFVFRDYRDELLQLGVDYGQTFDAVQDIALRWAQAGYNVRDSIENTKTSLLALNTAELDAAKATEAMIGIMAQWQLTSNDLPLVLDKINKTADDFTVTSQDLVDGLLRSSGAAKIMGLSIDQTISLLTVMREASGRTGREVGNALNSILSYIQRPISIKTLEGLGIEVFADQAKTHFRNVMEIFQDIEAKWQTGSDAIKDGFVAAADDAKWFSEELAVALGLQEEWNDLQQRDIAQASAGIYRRNYFIGMIERLTQAQEVLNNMTDAAGYSQTENARTMDTLEKKYTSLKTAAQQLAVALGDAGLLDILKGLTDIATDTASGFAELDDTSKALITTALELLSVMVALNSTMKLFTARNLFAGAGSILATIPGWGQLLAAIVAVTGALGLFAYNADRVSAQSAQDSVNAINAKKNEVSETNNLIAKYEELQIKERQGMEVKSDMLDIQRELARIYPEYVDGLDEEGNKIISNIPLIRELNALKQQELEIERQRLLMEANTQIPKLQAEQEKLQGKLDKNSNKLLDGDVYAPLIGKGGYVRVDNTKGILKEQKELMEQLQENRMELSLYKQALESLNEPIKIPPPGGTNPPPGDDDYGDDDGDGDGDGSGSTANTALQSALRILEYKKHLNLIAVEDEADHLRNIKDLYAKSAEERMDLDERIYDAEKSALDSRLQNSVNWINEKKALDQLSAEEEIAAWNRVLKNQKDNIEAVKQATLSLYKLQKELREEEFESYKSSLNDIQSSIKDAYNERIQMIEDEADAEIKKRQAKIDALDVKSEQESREESERQHNEKLEELQKDLQYHQLRTGKDHEEAVADIHKQIEEEKRRWELQLAEWTREDKKDELRKEIDDIKDAAEEEKEEWEKSYKLIEKAFDEHTVDIVAMAGAMSKSAYQQWVNNYLIPLQNALKSGELDDFGSGAGNLEGSTGGLSENALIYQAAKSIVSLKKQYEIDGNKSAAQSAIQYYNDLENMGTKGLNIAEQLQSMDYLRAKDYLGTLPKAHTGAEVLSYGAAYLKPGELVFPPNLSVKLESLIQALYARPGDFQLFDASLLNRAVDRIVNAIKSNPKQIGPLIGEQNVYASDEIDVEIMNRSLSRVVKKIIE